MLQVVGLHTCTLTGHHTDIPAHSQLCSIMPWRPSLHKDRGRNARLVELSPPVSKATTAPTRASGKGEIAMIPRLATRAGRSRLVLHASLHHTPHSADSFPYQARNWNMLFHDHCILLSCPCKVVSKGQAKQPSTATIFPTEI